MTLAALDPVPITERQSLLRSIPLSIFLVLVSYGLFRQGAFHNPAQQIFSVALVVCGVALTAQAAGRAALRSGFEIVSLLLLATVASAAVAVDRSGVVEALGWIAMLAVSFAAAKSVDERYVDQAIDAFVAVACVIAATAIWGVAAQSSPWGRITGEVWRGSSSITYANGAATLFGPMAVVAFVRASLYDRRLLAGASLFLLVGFTSTQSRGGAVALLIAVPLVLRNLGWQRSVRGLLPILVGLAISTPLLLALAGTDAVARPALVTVAVLVGLAATMALWPHRERVANPTILLAAGVVLVGVVIAVSGIGSALTARLSITSPTTASGADGQVLFGDRAKEWSTAWDQFTARPLLGSGPGNVDLRWTEGDRAFSAIYVHNEYLELMVTHGVIGLAALFGTVYLWTQLAKRNRERWYLGAAVTVYLVHSSFDFLWHIPALPAFFAACLGLLSAGGPENRRDPQPEPGVST